MQQETHTRSALLSHDEAMGRLDLIVMAPDTIPECHTPGARSVSDDATEIAIHAERCPTCKSDLKVIQKLEAAYTILERKNYPMGAIALPTVLM